MDNEYPKGMLKAPGPYDIHGGKFDYTVVQDEDEEAKAKENGWYNTTEEAAAAYAQSQLPEEPLSDCEREKIYKDQLRARLVELGVTVVPQWGVKRLEEELDKVQIRK